MQSPYVNRLAAESSPYLLQHANNPVAWYAWGDAAFDRARAENKPVLLSIGYSSCHWCHVMAHECFEDEAIAAQMNRDYICIKVDREERPDIDAIYMAAVQMLTGSGGWPLTAFLTPDRKAFHAGTYFPPRDLPGRPGFPRVLAAIAAAYRDKPEDVAHVAESLSEYVRQALEPPEAEPSGIAGAEILDDAFASLKSIYDPEYGGFGNGVKFPQPAFLEFLLSYFMRTGNTSALQMVTKTLRAIFRGGIWDVLAGGMHRYSTDHRWLVPHFEKMLYDNAQIAAAAASASRAALHSDYAPIATGILGYLTKYMQGEDGRIFASEDADSEGEEGKFYTWTYADLEGALGPQEAADVAERYGATRQGNWEGSNILYRPEMPGDTDNLYRPEMPGDTDNLYRPEMPGDADNQYRPEMPGDTDNLYRPEMPGDTDNLNRPEMPGDADDLYRPERPGGGDNLYRPDMPGDTDNLYRPEMPGDADRITDDIESPPLQRLLAVRDLRPRPFRDETVITAWNALTAEAFTRCAETFGGDFHEAAARNIKFITERLVSVDAAGLVRVCRNIRGATVGPEGLLEDYANVAWALVRHFETTGSVALVALAGNILKTLQERFRDEAAGLYRSVASDRADAAERPFILEDNAVPGGNSIAAEALLSMAAITGDRAYRQTAERILSALSPAMRSSPTAYARMLTVLSRYHSDEITVALIFPTNRSEEERRDWLEAAFSAMLANRVVAVADLKQNGVTSVTQPIAILQDRPPVNDSVTAYVCVNTACRLPITDIEEFAGLLKSFVPTLNTGAESQYC